MTIEKETDFVPTAAQQLATTVSTQTHINLIRIMLNNAAIELLRRGEVHDRSKFSAEEMEMFIKHTPRLNALEVNSAEYNACRAEMADALKHHYANNRHHPEHFENGIRGMNIIDVLEMCIDWIASSKRHATGNAYRSVESCAARFGMSDDLKEIFRNSIPLFDDVAEPEAIL